MAAFPQITLEWPPSQYVISYEKKNIVFSHYLGFEDKNDGILRESF